MKPFIGLVIGITTQSDNKMLISTEFNWIPDLNEMSENFNDRLGLWFYFWKLHMLQFTTVHLIKSQSSSSLQTIFKPMWPGSLVQSCFLFFRSLNHCNQLCCVVLCCVVLCCAHWQSNTGMMTHVEEMFAAAALHSTYFLQWPDKYLPSAAAPSVWVNKPSAGSWKQKHRVRMKNDVLRETFIPNQQEAEVSRVKCERVTFLQTANIITSPRTGTSHVYYLTTFLVIPVLIRVAAFVNVAQLDISGQFVAMSGILTVMFS